MSELLPCPFCGGKAKTVPATASLHRGMLRSWFVVCEDNECGCELGFYGMDENGTYGTYETEEEAIAAWNTRIDVERGAVPMTEENMAKHGWVRERTCTVTGEDYDEWLDEIYTQFSCGHEGYGGKGRFNYCPICGAKVVEDE